MIFFIFSIFMFQSMRSFSHSIIILLCACVDESCPVLLSIRL